VLDGELVFVPSEIPRRGVFALWGAGSGSAKLELVFPRGAYGIRKRLVSAHLIPLAEALPALLAIDQGPRMRRSGASRRLKCKSLFGRGRCISIRRLQRPILLRP